MHRTRVVAGTCCALVTELQSPGVKTGRSPSACAGVGKQVSLRRQVGRRMCLPARLEKVVVQGAFAG